MLDPEWKAFLRVMAYQLDYWSHPLAARAVKARVRTGNHTSAKSVAEKLHSIPLQTLALWMTERDLRILESLVRPDYDLVLSEERKRLGQEC